VKDRAEEEAQASERRSAEAKKELDSLIYRWKNQ